ncbi:HEAT repeat domain-containing protein [Amycolatopsis thailandensis]|uniref:HEAT repeat domain-containing protein n=1 Tax=Amycolatopsis thailandensis TaxID=589330 RepID=UPI0036692538
MELIFSLMRMPGVGRAAEPDEVLRHFGDSDGKALGVRLLRQSFESRERREVEAAVVVCFSFGISDDHIEPLLRLFYEDWHVKHEDVVTLLGRLKTNLAVDALYLATEWVPDYLDYDESRALATKAIWGLGEIAGPEAEQALTRALDSDCEIVREGAQAQLERRRRK